MDVLLSLPLLAGFLPSASYSSSLNFLFFYMTWSLFVLQNSHLKVVAIGTLASYVLFFIIPASLFLIFDTVLPSLAVELKIQRASGLPTRGGVRAATSKKLQWCRVIGFSLLNICLSILIQAGVDMLSMDVLQMGNVLNVTTTLPMPWVIVRDVVQMLVCRDVLQYAIHRWILHPSRKNYISRQHQNYAHSIQAPYAFTSHYDHPLAHLLHYTIPLYLPVLLFRPHVLTYLLQLSITTLAATLVHSGYTAVPGILLGGATRRCDLHYSSQGSGNFSSSGILDWICGTGVGADVMADLENEAEKHQVGERSGKALKGLKQKGKEGISSARRKSARKG